jgi:hypothetical protein
MNPLYFLLAGHNTCIGTHFDTGRGRIRRRPMHKQTLQSQPGETLRDKGKEVQKKGSWRPNGKVKKANVIRILDIYFFAIMVMIYAGLSLIIYS